ncbi:polysaccharide pyruvyl transferase family protein [Polycladomyces sp. WAk]|uniref:Polysaccharide pyruvyl transferase family protein n=1 Tax=Polycladomyces zharkentensis TaxID=2807616 RepID=A0ABS2WMM6_9BACL|nr:polysaccharide pyruvyl transferase family protein [Polycladomyces sp. WAk]MBN2910649.1 polysaccharide pyruvyl transferase family protein [Polycladomyces sp. WAk]
MQILLHGYYGAGNLGDDAILESIIDSFAQKFPKASFTVVSKGLCPAYRGPRRVKTIRIDSHSAVKNAVRQASFVVLGGGGILQDYNGWEPHYNFGSKARGMNYYGQVVDLAKKFGKPVYFYGIGAGPFFSQHAKQYAIRLLAGARRATVRDADSLKMVRSVGNIRLTADPALNLKHDPPKTALKYLRSEGVPVHKTLVGISLRPWKFKGGGRKAFIEAMAKVASGIVRNSKAHLVLLPFSRNGDAAVLNELAKRLPAGSYTLMRKHYPPKAMKGICGRLSLMIGMRLHSLILSAAMGVPVMGLSYDPKVALFMRSIRMSSYCHPLHPLPTPKMTRQALTLMKPSISWRRNYQSHVLKLKVREKQNIPFLFQGV